MFLTGLRIPGITLCNLSKNPFIKLFLQLFESKADYFTFYSTCWVLLAKSLPFPVVPPVKEESSTGDGTARDTTGCPRTSPSDAWSGPCTLCIPPSGRSHVLTQHPHVSTPFLTAHTALFQTSPGTPSPGRAVLTRGALPSLSSTALDTPPSKFPLFLLTRCRSKANSLLSNVLVHGGLLGTTPLTQYGEHFLVIQLLLE